MIDSSLLHRHIFLSSPNRHILNLLLNLIQKNILNESEILLILDGPDSNTKSLAHNLKLYNIAVLSWKEAKNRDLHPITLNSLSLKPHTAKIINHFIDNDLITSDKVNIIFTDEEIKNWYELYNETGALQTSEKAAIDEHVLRVLNIVDNYMTRYSIWGKKIELILNRKLNIVDAVCPFSVLDYDSQQCLHKFLHSRKKHNNNTVLKKSILLFSQPRNQKQTFTIIKSLLCDSPNLPSNTEITLGFWMHLDAKGLIYYTRLQALSKIKRSPIQLKLESQVSSERYSMMLHEYDSLILQERGGISTAKYFAEHIGEVITLKGTYNDAIFGLDYKVKLLNYETYEEALKSAIDLNQDNQKNRVKDCSNMIKKRHGESFETLRSYWNNF